MTVIRTSTGTVQEIATEDGPMTTAAGSRQMGVKDAQVSGATQIPGSDTYFYAGSVGMQEVSPVAGGPRLRVQPATADMFYLVSRNVDGSGDVARFQRNTGAAADSNNAGGKWPEWRVTGRSRIAGFAGDAASPTITFSDDAGAHGIVAANSGQKFFGEFHGLGSAGSLNSETLTMGGVAFDPTSDAATGNDFELRNSTTATDGTTIFTRDLSTTINAAGGIHQKINSISGTAVSFVFAGMAIGTGAFDEVDVQITPGGPWITLPPLGTTAARMYDTTAATVGMRLRDTATGRYVTLVGAALVVLANYVRSEAQRVTGTDRLKGYLSRFSSVAALAGAEWDADVGIDVTGSQFAGSNLLSNGNFATGDLTGWTKVQGAGNATVVSGAMRQVREAALGHRMRQTAGNVVTVADIMAMQVDMISNSAGLTPAARVANSVSMSATGAMVNQNMVVGRNLFLFKPNTTTIYVGDEYLSGTASETTDTDNYALYDIA